MGSPGPLDQLKHDKEGPGPQSKPLGLLSCLNDPSIQLAGQPDQVEVAEAIGNAEASPGNAQPFTGTSLLGVQDTASNEASKNDR